MVDPPCLFHRRNDFLHEKVKASFVQIEQSTFLEAAWQPFGSQSLAFFHSEGDKDVLIAEKAAEAARVTDTIMIADNTDILALLISRLASFYRRFYSSPETKFGGTSSACDISEIKQKLGTDVSYLMLFYYAVLGCDTTFHFYGIGKGRAVQQLLTDKSFRESAAIFGDKFASLDDIVEAGEKMLLLLYGCPDNLDTAEKLTFYREVNTATTFVHPQELPPTQAAAKYHSLPVYG